MIDNLKEEWSKSFDEAIKSIDKFIKSKANDGEEESKFKELAIWLLTNKHSPYDYMDNDWTSFKSNPYTCEVVLMNLHHAMVDDGDVSFVNLKIKGDVQRVFMKFYYPYDDTFREICIKDNQILIDSMIAGSELTFRVLTTLNQNNPGKNINVNQKLTMDDVELEVHSDSTRFIKDVENFQELSKRKNEEVSVRLKALRSSKP